MKKKAFTLIEILIVVVLLGILATVVMQYFTDSTDEARDAVLLSNAKIVNNAFELYKNKADQTASTVTNLVDQGYIEDVPDGMTGTWNCPIVITIAADGSVTVAGS
ncbi:MAG: type II secretion system GspH family protein [Phycisphaerae bacterium]|nr:type II secretion system GspH family protein [Phycisphaerae bacterium]